MSGLIEKFAASIRPFFSLKASAIDENIRRESNWLYPWEAVRETVINALVHRDWTRSVDIEVTSYSDLLEIIRDYGYVDARGMGVRKKMMSLVIDKLRQTIRTL